MSFDPETTRIVRSWLDEGVTQLPDRVLDAVLDQVPATAQRRATWWSVRRLQSMNTLLKFGLAAAVVALAVFIGVNTLGTSGTNLGGPGVEPTATPETSLPEPSAEPSPSPTSTPAAGLPEGPVELSWDGMPEGAPAVTVTIPAPGWLSPDGGILMKGEEVDNVPEAAVIIFSEPAGTEFFVYGDPCRWQSTTPETPATTVDEIAAALARQASREASEPVDVTVGGYAGKRITLSVPVDANFDECEGPEFATFGTETDELARYQQGPGQVDDLWILDVDGSIVIIDTMYRQDTPGEFIDELRSIAGSATFALP